MTGMLPVRSGLFGAKFPVLYPGAKGGFPDESLTIAEALSGAGYDTVMLGKWHLGDKPRYYPTRHGFDRWLGVPYSNDMDWVRYNDLEADSVTEEQIKKIRHGILTVQYIFPASPEQSLACPPKFSGVILRL